MAYDDWNWADWLRLGLSTAGTAAGAFGGGLTLPGAGATPVPSVAPIAPPIAPPIVPPPVMPNAGLPATAGFPTLTPNPAAPGYTPYVPGAPTPPGPLSIGPSPVPPPVVAPPGLAPPLAPPAPGTPPVDPAAPKSWWDRNIGDPVDKLWKGDGTDAAGKLSDRQKKLIDSVGGLGGALAKAGAAAPPPALPSGGGGGASAWRPAAFDAARLAAGRVAELQALRQKATLNAPWLQRYRPQGGGLMG